jgi:transcriptional regulator with XRE-family HTH domain
LAALSERDRESVSLFVDEMKADRAQRKWSQAELARQAHCSESSIAMVESYQRPPTASLAKALDKAFGTSGTYARMERRLCNLPFPASFRSFAPHEAEAATLSMFEHSLVPGLLQTPEYARAVLETKPNASDDEVENLVSGRVTRQSVLGRDDPPAPLMYALVDEGALNRPVAPPAVMHDQLAHLVDLSRKPNVTIQVVPYDAGGHSGLLGAFVIADRPSAARIVFIEDVIGGRVSEDAATVAEVVLRFNALRSEALPKRASRTRIESVAERWKEATSLAGGRRATAATTAATA